MMKVTGPFLYGDRVERNPMSFTDNPRQAPVHDVINDDDRLLMIH